MRARLVGRLAGLAVLLAAESAAAGCSDPPAPGVDYGRCQLDGSDLVGVDLTDGDLRFASFKRADLTEAVLNEVDAGKAKFVSATLRDVRLEDASLVETDFTNADLRDASFRGALLYMTRFFRADLRGADFTGAQLRDADFLHARLAGATWVDGETTCGEGSVGRCTPAREPKADARAGPAPAGG
ncbi:MAG: pentapeptide repeat-containing protein [Alphaproteobacteria bacterium]